VGAASTKGVGQVSFGEQSPFARTVKKDHCVRHPNFVYDSTVNPHDVSYCVLASDVTDVPIVPVLSACEAQQMIKPGQPVTLVGFGRPNSGHKYWVNTTISAVRFGGDEVVLGSMNAGSAPGDSGGPAYLQMPDKTWRVFGITSRGLNGDASVTAIYTVMSRYLDWIEKDSGIDITPCRDSGGAWVGGPACDKFPTDPGGMSGGTWANGCSAGPVATPAPTCAGQPPGGGKEAPDSGARTNTVDAALVDAGSIITGVETDADLPNEAPPPAAADALSTAGGGMVPQDASAGTGGSMGTTAAASATRAGCSCALDRASSRSSLWSLLLLSLAALGARRLGRRALLALPVSSRSAAFARLAPARIKASRAGLRFRPGPLSAETEE
jgi:hypothetical protein